jgi:UvrD-like helicase C-terminal domain/AAA domain
MNFLIADTFTDSLGRLTSQEQKAAKLTAFDLRMDPSAPGLSFHKLDRAKDPNFWSIRASSDLRLIVHRTAASLLLAYVGHHDAAYKWAERRKIERHPTTGAMQLVEVRERVEEVPILVAKPTEAPAPIVKPKLFDNLRKFELMAFGVPEEWVNDVRAADEDTLFDVIGHLPQEAQEALLKLAVGERPETPQPAPAEADPFAHPDALRRFRVFTNADELRRALDYPWEKWAVFLHPSQLTLVERNYSGPARVSGSAGTGKTVVALQRAAHLARVHPRETVLLTTFSKALAGALQVKLRSLTASEPTLASRIVVKAISDVGLDLYAERFGPPRLATAVEIEDSLTAAAAEVEGHSFSKRFLLGEWREVVDVWQLRDWGAYRDVARLGRKTRIGGKQREVLWSIFEKARAQLTAEGRVTPADVFARVTDAIPSEPARPYAFAVVDEAQDLGIAEARFLAALAGGKPNGLFFAGDLGQRIFQQPFSWKALGLDVRGRSFTLQVNYRTSHQIRAQADRLLPTTLSDVDGNSEGRRGTISVFDGPSPIVKSCRDSGEERDFVGRWIAARLREGAQPNEIGVFVRSEAELARARTAVEAGGSTAAELGNADQPAEDRIAIGTMHLAKGLEFRAVALMACDEDILPSPSRIENVADEADLEDVYDTERHLLYVACTRARDHLLVTGVEKVSEFLTDFRKGRVT